MRESVDRLVGRRVQIRKPSGHVWAGHGCPTRVAALLGATRPDDLDDQIRKLNAISSMAHGPDIISDLSLSSSSFA